MSQAELEIGPVEVSTGRDDVAGFRSALCHNGVAADSGGTVPLTFPIRWLSLPEIRDAILALPRDADTVVLHAGQSFDYEKPLVIDRSYQLSVRATDVSGGKDRLTVAGTVIDASDEVVLTMETTLVFLRRSDVGGNGL